MDRMTADWRDSLAFVSALLMIIGASVVTHWGVGLILAGIMGLSVAIYAAMRQRAE